MPSKEKSRHYLLKLLARMIYRVPWLFILLGFVAAVGGGWLTWTKLKYVSSTSNLVRPDAEYHQTQLAFLEEFGTADDFVVLVQGDQPERNRECAGALAEKFEASKRFTRVFWRIDFSGLEKRFLFFMPPEDLLQMEKRLGEFTDMLGSGGRPALDLNSMLARANSMFQEDFLRKEENWDIFKPFVAQFGRNLGALADRLEGKKETAEVESIDGLLTGEGGLARLEELKSKNEYLTFSKGRKFLLLLTPSKGDPTASSPHVEHVREARRIVSEVKERFPDISIGLTGEPVLDTDQIESSMASVARASVITLVLISLLFVLSYHELGRPFFALLTLVMAVLWSLGFATLAVGHLNIISNAFVAMILGLGIDFGIQFLGRYEEGISRGNGVEGALQESLANTGNAIMTGATTTAAAFYTMCFNDFVGLAELGVIGGTGIVFCLVANLVVFPAFVVVMDRRRKNLQGTASPTHWRTGIFLREPFARRPIFVTLLAVVGTGALAYSASHVRFDYNLLNLQNPSLEAVRVEKELLKDETRSVIYAVILANSVDEARAKAERVRQLESVQSVVTLSDLVPSDQATKREIIGRIVERLRKTDLDTDVSDEIDVRRARRELAQFLDNSRLAATRAGKYDKVSKRAREAEATFRSLIPALERALKAFEGKSQTEVGRILNAYQVKVFGELGKALKWLTDQETDRLITEEDIPPQLLQRYRGKSGRVLVEVYPKEYIWDRAPLERFVEELRTVDPQVTGSPIQYYEYLEVLRRAFEKAGIYALVVICLTLLIHYRSFRFTLLTLVPLALAVVWTVGVMPLWDLAFNPANLITLPLLIGIGVAYGIYTVDRFREGASVSLFETSTAKAVWLSALTTIFGFASLIQASYRGISGLGKLMTLGVAMCLLASLYVLPSLLKLFGRQRVAKPTEPPPAG